MAQVSPGEGKVAAVCSALRASMLASSPDLFLKPLATSHAIQGDPESALLLVKEAKEAQLAREASCGEASTPGSFLSALQAFLPGKGERWSGSDAMPAQEDQRR